MIIYIIGSTNRPSGGTKVMHQIANLFIEKGYKSYVVVEDDSECTFLCHPAPSLSFQDFEKQIKAEDITITFWTSRKIVESIDKKINYKRILWYHGASLPTGKNALGEYSFSKESPFTQFWNVSKVCAEYLEQKYSLSKKMGIVYPFFDTEEIQKHQNDVDKYKRNGILMLARRGKKYIDLVKKKMGNKTKITILEPPYHEEEFFNLLLKHKFFVSVDPGVDNFISINRIFKNGIKCAIDSDFRTKYVNRHKWIVPEGHLLGFPMPPIEAALLGCTVIGFAMGGGLEWMNTGNCFLAHDRDKKSLLDNIQKALGADETTLEMKRQSAYESTQKFTREHTWVQLSNLLNL